VHKTLALTLEGLFVKVEKRNTTFQLFFKK